MWSFEDKERMMQLRIEGLLTLILHVRCALHFLVTSYSHFLFLSCSLPLSPWSICSLHLLFASGGCDCFYRCTCLMHFSTQHIQGERARTRSFLPFSLANTRSLFARVIWCDPLHLPFSEKFFSLFRVPSNILIIYRARCLSDENGANFFTFLTLYSAPQLMWFTGEPIVPFSFHCCTSITCILCLCPLSTAHHWSIPKRPFAKRSDDNTIHRFEG